jgi:HTH-type transcriptional regulator / antitoxin HipB
MNRYVFKEVSDLGQFVRDKRKSDYGNLDSGAKALTVGKRFLSEFERGKETAQIGKILKVLHGLNLDLAVVEREKIESAQFLKKGLSEKLGLDFPYDWSNLDMSEESFIHAVLKKGRFMDILKTTHYFGLERVETEAKSSVDDFNCHRVEKILQRIRIGSNQVSK